MNRLSLYAVVALLLCPTFCLSQITIDLDSTGTIRILGQDYSPANSNPAQDEIRLYLVGSHRDLALTPGSAFSPQIIRSGESFIWDNYFLEGDITGTEYSFFVWALSFGTTQFRAEIIIHDTTIAVIDFSSNRSRITNGTLWRASGMDPAANAGDEVKLKISHVSGADGVVSTGAGADSYVTIPGTMPTAVEDSNEPSVPDGFKLDQNYPNPFNPETAITYQLPTKSQVKLEIYNLLGQRVATLVDKQQQAGNYSLTWNGKEDSGKDAASGIYLYRLQTEDFVQARKLTLLR